MQRTIRILRVALPAAFFGFVLLIALSWNRARTQKEGSTNEPVTSTIRPIDKPQIESKTFEDTQTIAGRVAAHIRAERVVAFQSGWNTLESVQLTIFRPNGLTYDVVCPEAQFNSDTKEADAKGGVTVKSTDGVVIQTAEIHFDGNRLTNHIPVHFTIDRWSGNAGSIDLDVQAELLSLHDNVEATMQPQTADEQPMNLKSHDAVFRRNEHSVEFTSNVVATRGADRTTADRMVAHFTPDRKSLTGLEGQGHVDILMAAADQSGGRKEIFCDRFWSEPGAAGQIAAIDAAGDQSPAHAILDGPPKRDLVAAVIRVGLTNRQVTDLQARGKVVMKELGPMPRDMSADTLTVYFDPRTHRATNAAAEGDFHYKDPRNEASAVRANYDVANDSVVLTATPGFQPSVTSDGQTLKGKTIEFSPRAGTAKASGDIIAQLVSKNGPAANGTTIFPANKPVFVNSDSVTMQQAAKTAIFTGHVRAWQDSNTLFANELQVHGMGDEVDARGGVRTVLYNTGGGTPRKTPMQTESDALAAHKEKRTIDLLGNVKIDDEDRHLTSDKATFDFDANRKLETIIAENHVVLIEQAAGRKGTGDKAIYHVDERKIFMSGSPAVVTAPNGTVSGQEIAVDLSKNKVDVLSTSTAVKGTYKQQP